MTRYQILITQVALTAGSGNNLGSTCLIQQRGRIRAVQFALTEVTDIGTGGDAQSMIQVGKTPAYTAPTPQNGTNPTEAASALLGFQNDDTATQARLVTVDAQYTVAADMPVSEGEQIFVNAVNMGGAAEIGNVCGFITIFVE